MQSCLSDRTPRCADSVPSQTGCHGATSYIAALPCTAQTSAQAHCRGSPILQARMPTHVFLLSPAFAGAIACEVEPAQITKLVSASTVM